jgi:hypothetical protein
MVQDLFHLIRWQFLSIDEGLLKRLLRVGLKLDETIVQHEEPSVLWLDIHSSKDDLGLWIVSPSADQYRDYTQGDKKYLTYILGAHNKYAERVEGPH